jgi:hypothetical protein
LDESADQSWAYMVTSHAVGMDARKPFYSAKSVSVYACHFTFFEVLLVPWQDGCGWSIFCTLSLLSAD